MGLISGLVLAPVRLVTWTAERILDAAEAEFYDEGAIAAALADLNERYDRGLIDESSFLAAEDALLDRLDVARTRGRG